MSDQRGDRIRELLGAAALDRLTAGEQAELDAIVLDEPAVIAEIAALARTASLLEGVDADRFAAATDAPPADLGRRVHQAIEEADATRRRRTRVRVLAAAAAVVLVVSVTVLVSATGDESGQPFAVAPAGVEAQFTIDGDERGSTVELTVDGLADGIYWLWVSDAEEDRSSAGTFRGGSPLDDAGFTAALPIDDAVRVWVTDAADEIVLDATVGGG